MRAFALALLLAVVGCGPSYHVTTVAYDPAHPQLVADVYEQRGDDRQARPVVLAIHGGAWQSLTRKKVENLATALVRQGFVVIAPDYRLSSEAVWPAQLDDVSTCLGFVSSAATVLRLDPKRVGAAGVSAGGQLASMLALKCDDVRVFCAMAGESDLTKPDAFPGQEGILHALYGHTPTREELWATSPLAYVRAGKSACLVHSVNDWQMNVEQSDMLDAGLRAAGSSVVYLRRDGFTHDPTDDASVMLYVGAFFKAKL